MAMAINYNNPGLTEADQREQDNFDSLAQDDASLATRKACARQNISGQMMALTNLNTLEHELTADELRVRYYDPLCSWDGEGQHLRFTKWDWFQIVAQRSTLLGYWDWVASRIEHTYYEAR
jgi:hypothetical protein